MNFSLLHNPEILFLDEPTIGIDVLAKAKIRDFIHKMNQERNTIIILTTHDISDIEALCIIFENNLAHMALGYTICSLMPITI